MSATAPSDAPAVVTVHLWTVSRSGIAPALARLALDRYRLRGYPGLTFAKLLGVGSGQTFAPQDADPYRWALLTCWDSPQAAATVERSRIIGRWDAAATERLRLTLRPVSSIGRWSGQQPFGSDPTRPADGGGTPPGGPVASLTRARIKPAQLRSFWKTVPDVAQQLNEAEGLLWSIGVGEAPIGLQGTFSVWRSTEDLQRFAYQTSAHQRVIRRTRETQWFAEELFARFSIIDSDGTVDGTPLPVP